MHGCFPNIFISKKKTQINPTNKLFTKPQNSNRNITTLAIHLLYAAIIMIFED